MSFVSGIFRASQRNDQAPGCFIEGARQGLRESHTQHRRRALEAKPYIAPGTHDLHVDDHDDGDSLPIDRSLGVNEGVQKDGYKFCPSVDKRTTDGCYLKTFEGRL